MLQDKRGVFRKVTRPVRFDFRLDLAPFLHVASSAQRVFSY